MQDQIPESVVHNNIKTTAAAIDKLIDEININDNITSIERMHIIELLEHKN